MRLTNYIRDAFVRSALNDVPKEDFDERAKKLVETFLQKTISETFPGISIQSLVKDGWIQDRSYFLLPNQLNMVCIMGPHNNTFLRNKPIWTELEKLAAKKTKQNEDIDKLQATLKSVAYSCSTTQALRKALPEFSKYLPAEVQGANTSTALVQTNVVEMFRGFGWPKQPEA